MDASERLGAALALQQELQNENARRICDLFLSMYLAAVKSPRRASVCRPCPAHLLSTHSYQSMAAQLDQLPCLPRTDTEYAAAKNLQLQLLQWLLLHQQHKRTFQPALITAVELASELHTAGYEHGDSPHFHNCRCILRLDKPSHLPPQKATSKSRMLVAYHGTDFSNLHSILHNGLLSASGTRLQSTGAVFGSGIYLAQDFDVAYAFCKAREGWCSSSIGRHLRCVLLCEVDENIAVLGGAAEVKRVGNKLPSKYVLVPEPRGVVVRYLLVFSDDALLGQPAAGAQGQLRHGAAALCMYITVAYVALMLVLAVWGSWRGGLFW